MARPKNPDTPTAAERMARNRARRPQRREVTLPPDLDAVVVARMAGGETFREIVEGALRRTLSS